MPPPGRCLQHHSRFSAATSGACCHAWVPHIVVGLLIAGYALVTDTSDSTQAAGTDGMTTATRNNR